VAQSVRAIPPSGIRDFFDIVSEMEDTISLGVGEPGFPAPWHIRDSSIYALERGATAYTSNLGLRELRERIARYGEAFFGVSYDPDREILITTGVSEAYDLAVRAIVDPGDEIIYHEPCYVSYAPIVQLAHGVPIAIRTDPRRHFRLTREQLLPRLTPRTKALLLNFPNNPTGATLTPETARDLADLAREHNLLVISDEIYAELTFEGRHTCIASLPGMKERTILLHGFSKAWAMTGFRIGYCCAPAELLQAMMTIHQYTMLCAPTIAQIAAIEALKGAGKDVPEMNSRYLRNRNFMCATLRELGIPFSTPGGAFYLFPFIGELGLSSRDFALRLLEEERVAVVPGTAFGPSGEGFLRLTFATSLDNIKPAMQRLAHFVDRLRRERQRPSASG
jgi:aminotransferase